MDTHTDSRIISADRTSSGIIVTFEDGKSAIYSATLRRAMFSQAQELLDFDENE
jgi:hypothetical protein